MLIAGIDFSSHAIDVAVIPLDPETIGGEIPAVTLRRATLPTTPDLRLHAAAKATTSLLTPVNGWDITSVWIEEPWTRMWPAARALFTLDGAITAAASGRGRAVAHLNASTWKKLLGLGAHGKQGALERATTELVAHNDVAGAGCLTSDQADALCIALAGRALCWEHAA